MVQLLSAGSNHELLRRKGMTKYAQAYREHKALVVFERPIASLDAEGDAVAACPMTLRFYDVVVQDTIPLCIDTRGIWTAIDAWCRVRGKMLQVRR